MTTELLYYLFLCLVGLGFCLRKIKSEGLYFSLTLSLFIIYSCITRYSGFDIDMNTYSEALKAGVFSIYYLREPVYWVFSRYIYDFTNSAEITFIVYDIMSFILILNARKNMGLPQYFPYLFILFFPSVMGLNNVFRQYLSYSVFIYFISILFIDSGFFKRSFWMIIAVLTHNVSALFSPIFFLFNKKKQVSFKSVGLGLLVIIVLPIALGTKSSSDTGNLGVGVYLFVLFALFIFYCMSYKSKLNFYAAKFFYFFIFLISLTSISAILMGSAQSKRVGMYALIICLIPLVKAIEENYHQKKLVRVIIYVTLILPTLIFSSSLDMLLTSNIL